MSVFKITMVDGSTYEKLFPTCGLAEQFIAKLELFDGLFIDLALGHKQVRINPKFIVKIEQLETQIDFDIAI